VSISERIIDDFSAIGEAQWNRLGHRDNPFLSHAFLGGLESSGSIHAESGWVPHHLALFEGAELVAFAPTYVKSHSHGEFVFDWAWADAYRRHGLAYYPKLLTGIPYSPVTGPRLLTAEDHHDPGALRGRLLDFAARECERQAYSSWHCNFVPDEELATFEAAPLLGRNDWQFHWRNRNYADFEDFLDRLRSRKRKNIRRERRRVSEAGIGFRHLRGHELSDRDFEFIYGCYVRTFLDYGNHPALKPEFFRHIARQLDERFLAIIAERAEEPIAMGLFLAGGGRLYGRYWGCTEEVPGLHFEVAYYQGIEYCIRNGLAVFEAGAQGEHKISRGFEPTRTHSFHLVRNEAFRAAIARALQRESAWLGDYREVLAQQDPFRQDAA
jgi:predicted N-acyltransferase